MFYPFTSKKLNIRTNRKTYYITKLQIAKHTLNGNNSKIVDGTEKLLKNYCYSQKQFLAECETLIRMKEYEKAQTYLLQNKNMFEDSVDEERYYYLMARCYYFTDRLSEAIHYFDKALELNLFKVEYLENQVDCYLEQGKWKKAIEIINKGLRISPTNNRLLFKLSNIFLFHGEYSKSLDCLNGCCKIKPFISEYWELKAEAHLYLNQYKLAIKAYKRAIFLVDSPITFNFIVSLIFL